MVDETARDRLRPRPELLDPELLALDDELTLTLDALALRELLEAEAAARPLRRVERAERTMPASLRSHRTPGP